MSEQPSRAHDDFSIVLKVSRGRACRRGLAIFLPGAAILAWVAWQLGKLSFVPSGVSNRFPEYAWAFVYLLLGWCGAGMIWRGGYWLAVGLWPRAPRIIFNPEHVDFELFPMGRKVYDAASVRVIYPFDDEEDADEGLYESLQDPEGYAARYLPKIIHPQAADRLDLMVRHLVSSEENELAMLLKPFIVRKRGSLPKPPE